jgi:hypothetical protein
VFPDWLKLASAAFVAVLVPVYWRQYGPGNFLWFSDVGLLVASVALWLEQPLLASTQAVALIVPESLWILELVLRLTTGVRVIGLTDYMFDDTIPRFVRALSLFHVWLPGLLIWMVYRLGYDRRALVAQILLGAALLVASFFLTAPRDNVNWVHRCGPLRGLRSLMMCLAAFPLGFYLPAHLLLLATMPSSHDM